MSIDLKPCPFCGGKADFNNDGERWDQVICGGCGCRGTEYPNDRVKAAWAWNRRVVPDEPQGAGMSRDDAQSLVFDLLDAARSFDRAETGFRKDAREYYEEVRDKVIAALSLSRPK